MKNRIHIEKAARPKLLKMAVFALVIGIAGSFMLQLSHAATGTSLFVTPASSSVQQGSSINVEVRLDTAGQNVDGVEAYLTYPDTLFECISTSEAGSAFGIGFPGSCSGGNLVIRRTVNPSSSPTVTGSNLLVATVNFKARTGSGTAAVNFTPQSRVTAPSAGTGSVLVNTVGGSYNLTPVPATPTQTSPNTTPTTSGSTSGTTSPTAAPPAPGSTTNTTVNKPPAPKASTPSSPPAGATSTTTVVPPSDTNTATAGSQALQPNVIPLASSNTGSASHSPRRHSILPLMAKIAGTVLLIGSLGVLVRLILTIRHHHLIPVIAGIAGNTGVASAPYNYQASPQPTKPTDKPSIESQIFQSSPAPALTPAPTPTTPSPATLTPTTPTQPTANIQNIATPQGPEPGEVIRYDGGK